MTSLLETPPGGLAAEYAARGFVRVTGLLSPPETHALRAEADRLAIAPGLLGNALRGAVRTNGPRFDRLDPVIDVSDVFAALATDSRLQELATRLLGGACQLMKDKFIRKSPGERGYSVHQDVAYWQEMGIPGERIVTLAVLIDRSTAENGAMQFAPGHHRRLLTPPGVVSDPVEADLGPFETVTGEPGDIVAFSALAPHRSAPNRSPENRAILFLTYARDERIDLYSAYREVSRNF